MDIPENDAAVLSRTCAAKSLGDGEKGDAGQMARSHWHGNLGKLSTLSMGFLEKNLGA